MIFGTIRETFGQTGVRGRETRAQQGAFGCNSPPAPLACEPSTGVVSGAELAH